MNPKPIPKRIGALLLCFALLAGLLPASALAAETANSVEYIDADGTPKTCTTATVVENHETAWSDTEENDGWYVVNSDVTISDRITVTGEVHLILKDNCTLTAKGITVSPGNSFTIYGQTQGTGTLTATCSGDYGAGIGGGYNHQTASGEACGTVTINGGHVTAEGGTNSAGIGGSSSPSGSVGDGGTVTINGGVVTAKGGHMAAGIGGGGTDLGTGGAGGAVTINGGVVTATGGGNYGAGIGGGGGSYGGDGGTVTINGGVVKASGSSYGAGIGGGGGGGTGGGVGGTFSTGENGSAVIFAQGGENAAAISNTSGQGSWQGAIFQGNEGQVYGGTVTPTESFTIPADHTLTIGENQTLVIDEGITLTNNGTILLEGGRVEGTVTGNQPGYRTLVNVSVDQNPADFGSSVTLTATVTGGPDTINSGTVTFYQGDATGNALNNGGTNVSSGTAAYTIPFSRREPFLLLIDGEATRNLLVQFMKEEL